MPDNTPSWGEALDAAFAEYFTWKGEAIHEVKQTQSYKRLRKALNSVIKELVNSSKPEKETFVEDDGAGSQQFNDFANGYNHALSDFEANIIKAIDGKAE